MISDSGFDSGSSPELASEDPPMSRTHQYRKVMKPLLERKRRARINKCLDDLKDLMVTALKSEGESITKLEKADVLELTVKYLRKLKRQNALGLTPQATYAAKFRVGYVHCAQDVSRFMSSMQATGNSSSVDVHVSTRLLSHLANCCQALETMSPSVVSMAMSPPPPPMPVTPQTSSLPVYSHLPTSAFSPVIAHSSVEQRHLLPVKEESERFEVRSNGKENQAMDLSKSTYNRIPSRQMIEPITQAKDDPNWRPW